MQDTLTGPYTTWELFDVKRQYGTVQNLPYEAAVELIMPVRFNGQTGKGSQRDLVVAHVRKLKGEMRKGLYTPTNVSASCTDSHRKGLTLGADGQFGLTLDSEDPLNQSDGQHRFEAVRELAQELKERIEELDEGREDDGLGPKEKVELANCCRWLAQIKTLPVTVTVYFDGNPARDFVALQMGKAVDASHLFSLSVQEKMATDPDLATARDVARQLHKQEGSPFQNCIRFDSRGSLPLPLKTLCATGASDLGVSLVGLAKVGRLGGHDRGVAFMARAVADAYRTLVKVDEEMVESSDDDLGILGEKRVLTPMANGGTKGSSTMLVGVGVCLAYRLAALGRETATDEDLTLLADAARQTLDHPVSGSFTSPEKRRYLGRFASVFLDDLEDQKWHRLPIGLLSTLSCSAFGVEKMPAVKPAKVKKVAKLASDEADVDVPWEGPSEASEELVGFPA
jgi:hypothetical protein